MKIKLLFLVVNLFIFFQLFAQEHGNKVQKLELKYELLATDYSQVQVSDILNGQVSTFFQEIKYEQIPNQQKYWIKLSVNNLSKSSKIVISSTYKWDKAYLYAQDSSFNWVKQETGIHSPLPEYAFELKSYFLIKPPKGEISTYYLYLEADTRSPDFELSYDDFSHFEERTQKIKYIYFGGLSVLLVMIIYHILLYLSVRQSEYIPYIIIKFGFLGGFGMSFFYNYFHSNIFYLFVEQSFYLMIALGFISFTRYYLSTKQRFPKFHSLLSLFAALIVSSFIVHETLVFSLATYPEISLKIWVLSVFLMVLAIFIFDIRAIIRKYKRAQFFLITTLIPASFAIYLALIVQGTIHSSTQTEAKAYFLLSFIFMLILLSLGMGNKLSKLQKEKNEALERNLLIQRDINEKLDIKVKERTIELEEKNEELEQQKEEITAQRDRISEQKREITDSISYASKIQSAILPHKSKLEKFFPEHFVLFLPRDVVSGDFYWFHQMDKQLLLAVADCTGHGVPGAFMSMLGVSMLNEIVRDEKTFVASKILDKLRVYIKEALNQTASDAVAKDGMDMALCVIDTEKNQLQYAGAYNPLVLIRNSELTIFKGDRMPVGIYPVEKSSFTNHIIPLVKGDMLYLFSDGFVDQFGGKDGKKFKAINLHKQLLAVSSLELKEQKKQLRYTFDKWRGDKYKQIDDVLLVGIRYSIL